MKFNIFLVLALFFNSAIAQIVFKKLDPSFNQIVEMYEVPNMPRVRDQGDISRCDAFCTWTMFHHAVCKENKLSCANLLPQNEMQILQIGAWNVNDNKSDLGNKPENHRQVFFDVGANPVIGTKNLGDELTRSLVMGFSEACFSFDKFLEVYGKDEKTFEDFLSKVKNFRNEFQNVLVLKNNNRDAIVEADFCFTCVRNILSKFDLNLDDESIRRSFSKKNVNNALYQLFVPTCTQKTRYSVKLKNQTDYYEEPNQKTRYEYYISKIKELMSRSNPDPILLNSLCFARNQQGKCILNKNMEQEANKKIATHCAVVAGYRRVCNPAGKCKEMIKIHNSWGKKWQDSFDGGWVDAETLLDQESFLGSLNWYDHDKDRR